MPDSASLLGLFQKEFALQDDQVKQLQNAYFTQGISLMDAFEQIAITDENRILRVLADRLQLPLLEREDYPEKPVLLEGVSMFFLRKHAVLPIQVESGRVRVVVNNPLNIPVLNILGSYFAGMELNLCLGQREEIRTAIDRLYGTAAREAEALSRNGEGSLFNTDCLRKISSTSKVWPRKLPSSDWSMCSSPVPSTCGLPTFISNLSNTPFRSEPG